MECIKQTDSNIMQKSFFYILSLGGVVEGGILYSYCNVFYNLQFVCISMILNKSALNCVVF